MKVCEAKKLLRTSGGPGVWPVTAVTTEFAPSNSDVSEGRIQIISGIFMLSFSLIINLKIF